MNIQLAQNTLWKGTYMFLEEKKKKPKPDRYERTMEDNKRLLISHLLRQIHPTDPN